MATDDRAARKERAKRLRKQIEKIASPGEKEAEEQQKEARATETPREFIRRRMKEIQEEESA